MSSSQPSTTAIGRPMMRTAQHRQTLPMRLEPHPTTRPIRRRHNRTPLPPKLPVVLMMRLQSLTGLAPTQQTPTLTPIIRSIQRQAAHRPPLRTIRHIPPIVRRQRSAATHPAHRSEYQTMTPPTLSVGANATEDEKGDGPSHNGGLGAHAVALWIHSSGWTTRGTFGRAMGRSGPLSARLRTTLVLQGAPVTVGTPSALRVFAIR